MDYSKKTKKQLIDEIKILKNNNKLPDSGKKAVCLENNNLKPDCNQIEEALKKSEKKLSEIIQGNSIATFVIDEKHIITFWNKACENLTGLSAKDMIGTKKQWMAFYSDKNPVMADLIVSESPEKAFKKNYGEKYKKSELLDGAYESENYFPDLGKNGKWLFFTAVPLKDISGRITGAIETLQDITERKLAEEKLLKHEEHLEELVNERTLELKKINETLQREIFERKLLYRHLEDKNRELESFVYTASHDLKAPLVILGGYSSILLKKYHDKLDKDGLNYLSLLQTNVYRMERMIMDLLELSKMGRVLGKKEYINVESIINKIKKTYKPQFDQNKIKLNLLKPLPEAYGDKIRIYQVFENLIINSIKFFGNQENPEIEIGAEEIDENFYQFYVKDNGIGIARSHQKLIFKEFHRLNDIETEGTGIGLAIVKKIVEHHNGSIRVESAKKKGSTFFFLLPKK